MEGTVSWRAGVTAGISGRGPGKGFQGEMPAHGCWALFGSAQKASSRACKVLQVHPVGTVSSQAGWEIHVLYKAPRGRGELQPGRPFTECPAALGHVPCSPSLCLGSVNQPSDALAKFCHPDTILSMLYIDAPLDARKLVALLGLLQDWPK